MMVQLVYLCLVFFIGLTRAMSSDIHSNPTGEDGKPPNLVLILADDVGYGDFASYGHPTQEWGAVDQLAAEGRRFTQWTSADTLCSPSRAAILTGRMARRIGVFGGHRVFFPGSSQGLPRSEETLAEVLKDAGYATGMVGKWHLGINQHTFSDGNHLPAHHGFDFVGSNLPFSSSFSCDETKNRMKSPNCYVYRNHSIKQQPIAYEYLASDIVMDAKAFIYNHSDRPFFLYMSLHQAHTPMVASKRFQNSSKRGEYGDTINEMQWMVGEVVDLLLELSLDKSTLVLFLSDHGPNTPVCSHGGETSMFRGSKGNFLEGGVRVPAIAWWPGRIRPSVSSTLVSSLDIFPTVLDIFGVSRSHFNQTLDGKSVRNILLDGRDERRNETLLFYCDKILMAARRGKYKIHFAEVPIDEGDQYSTWCTDGVPEIESFPALSCDLATILEEPLLYNVEVDPGEKFLLNLKNHEDLINEIIRDICKIESSFDDVPALCDFEYTDDSLVPCCNPPYCTCNYPN